MSDCIIINFFWSLKGDTHLKRTLDAGPTVSISLTELFGSLKIVYIGILLLCNCVVLLCVTLSLASEYIRPFLLLIETSSTARGEKRWHYSQATFTYNIQI